MGKTITLKEIALELGVPESRIKLHFEKGQLLEFVPRPVDPNAEWVIYRQDYERALAQKQEQMTNQFRRWDELFSIDALSLD